MTTTKQSWLKRSLAVMLAVLMVMSMGVANVFAADGNQASVAVDNQTTEYPTFADAVAALKDAKDGLTAKADDSDDGEGSGQKPDTDKPGTGSSGSDSSQTDNGSGSGNQAAGSSTPKTGDSTPILVVLAFIAMAAAVAGIVVRKRFRA